MSSLNFLICLFLRDKQNETGIRDVASELRDNYLSQIGKGLSLARAHYQLRLSESQDPKCIESSFEETTLTIGGRVMPILNRDQVQLKQIGDQARLKLLELTKLVKTRKPKDLIDPLQLVTFDQENQGSIS